MFQEGTAELCLSCGPVVKEGAVLKFCSQKPPVDLPGMGESPACCSASPTSPTSEGKCLPRTGNRTCPKSKAAFPADLLIETNGSLSSQKLYKASTTIFFLNSAYC